MMIVDTIINAVNTVIDKVIPDANVREQVKMAVQTQALALYKLEISDKESARQREIQVKDSTPRRLAYIMIGGFLGISTFQVVSLFIWGDMARHVPPEAWVMVGNISGYLASEAKMASTYYFGTSSGSSEKTAILDRIVNHK